MTRIKIQRHKRAPKTYKTPKGLSLDATGLLAHMRENIAGDGTYRWGVQATADFFGLSGRSRIIAAYNELEKAKLLIRIDVPRDSSQKQPPTVVKLNLRSQITTAQLPVNTGRNESRDEKVAQKAVFTGEHLPSPTKNNLQEKPTTASSEQTTTVSPIAPNIGMFTGEHGSLDAEIHQAESALAEFQKAARETVAKFGNDGGFGRSIEEQKKVLAKLRNRRDMIEAERER